MRLLLVALVFSVLSMECHASRTRSPEYWRSFVKKLVPQVTDKIKDGIAEHFNGFIERYDLSNDKRIAHFFGQIALESAHLTRTTEMGGNAYFAKYGRGQRARNLGNTQPGDGPRFKGRGLIQLTGRANYRKVGQTLGKPFESNPDMVAEFPDALESAGVYWKERFIIDPEKRTRNRGYIPQRGQTLNTLADANNYRLVCFNTNGGFNHRAEREALTKKAARILAERPSAAELAAERAALAARSASQRQERNNARRAEQERQAAELAASRARQQNVRIQEQLNWMMGTAGRVMNGMFHTPEVLFQVPQMFDEFGNPTYEGPPATVELASQGDYYYQIGVFRNEQNAKKMADENSDVEVVKRGAVFALHSKKRFPTKAAAEEEARDVRRHANFVAMKIATQ